jgi:hypothetical protein
MVEFDNKNNPVEDDFPHSFLCLAAQRSAALPPPSTKPPSRADRGFVSNRRPCAILPPGEDDRRKRAKEKGCLTVAELGELIRGNARLLQDSTQSADL